MRYDLTAVFFLRARDKLLKYTSGRQVAAALISILNS